MTLAYEVLESSEVVEACKSFFQESEIAEKRVKYPLPGKQQEFLGSDEKIRHYTFENVQQLKGLNIQETSPHTKIYNMEVFHISQYEVLPQHT